jgi:hypothetical protein
LSKSTFSSPNPLTTPDLSHSSNRGRPLQRDDSEGWVRARTTSESANKTSSRASRKGASMVFLGVWAFFGIGTLAGSRSLVDHASVGRVLAVDAIRTTHLVRSLPDAVIFDTISPPSSDIASLPFQTLDIIDHGSPNRPKKGSSGERLIGRVFAWLCTTLYLTSRLPQIWKNVCPCFLSGVLTSSTKSCFYSMLESLLRDFQCTCLSLHF